MGSAFDFQEIMAAAMRFGTTDTIEAVIARHEEREKMAEERRKRKAKSPFPANAAPRPPTAPVAGEKPLPTDEMSKLRAMLAQGHSRVPPAPALAEVGSPPDE